MNEYTQFTFQYVFKYFFFQIIDSKFSSIRTPVNPYLDSQKLRVLLFIINLYSELFDCCFRNTFFKQLWNFKSYFFQIIETFFKVKKNSTIPT